MRSYPILLNLAEKHCLVVGAGQVGVRKIKGLLDAGAGGVLVVDMAEPTPELAKLLSHPALRFEQRTFRDEDLDGRFLVFAATSNKAVNKRVGELCRKRGLLCNIADQPENCDFIVPATLQRGELMLTVSTGGHSPAFSRKIRKELETLFGCEYEQLLAIMGRVRPLLLALDRPTAENTNIFRALANSDLPRLLATKDADAVRSCLAANLPQELHPNIPELLDGIL
ncbi:MAG: bifunctional precorrin-2 dehydrogenase/sirohydrochlorin ferrochelatase [Desulfovibrio sp.]